MKSTESRQLDSQPMAQRKALWRNWWKAYFAPVDSSDRRLSLRWGQLTSLLRMLVHSFIRALLRDLGSGNFAPFHLSTSDDWWRLLEVNLRAPTDLVRAVLPSMLERNSGTIICTVSRAALLNVPFSSVSLYSRHCQ